MTTSPEGAVVLVGVLVGVGLGVLVGVLVEVGLGVLVGVLVEVGLGVLVGVLVEVGLGVLVGVLVEVGLGVLVGVAPGSVPPSLDATTENTAELRATVRPDLSLKRAATLCEPSPSDDKSNGLAVPSGAVPARSNGGVPSVSVSS
jgi:hypothetical protein